MIDLRRDIELSAPVDAVWQALWDVPALARCIPGCGEVETIEDTRRYRTTIRDRVGPFRIGLLLDVSVHATPPTALALSASGRDSVLGSPVSIDLVVTLEDAPPGARLSISGRGDVGGKLATLGQGMIQRKSRDVLDQFAANLARYLRPGSDAPSV
jgi:carbon monoxide dehydrogenase subunit G